MILSEEGKQRVKHNYIKYETLCTKNFDARAKHLNSIQYVHVITNFNSGKRENSLVLCCQEKTLNIKLNTKLNRKKDTGKKFTKYKPLETLTQLKQQY